MPRRRQPRAAGGWNLDLLSKHWGQSDDVPPCGWRYCQGQPLSESGRTPSDSPRICCLPIRRRPELRELRGLPRLAGPGTAKRSAAKESIEPCEPYPGRRPPRRAPARCSGRRRPGASAGPARRHSWQHLHCPSCSACDEAAAILAISAASAACYGADELSASAGASAVAANAGAAPEFVSPSAHRQAGTKCAGGCSQLGPRAGGSPMGGPG
mmetsp:Transcript_41110/g.66429  ORF Transcript_41110/g.66429 Transcript_41110/m.66429 type:complete len:212 (+) Transcript_41110:147-782(+)